MTPSRSVWVSYNFNQKRHANKYWEYNSKHLLISQTIGRLFLCSCDPFRLNIGKGGIIRNDS